MVLHLAAGPAAHPIADRALDFALVVGPGFAVCFVAWLIRQIYRSARHHLARANQQVEAALTGTVPAAADNQPGTDTELLDTITAAWNADLNTRKETP
ncbi:hypothetical protein ACPC36_07895 [Streptomyces pseudogriseolus]|uniref:hypothetical protein n=1 Tax=Streptomyces pseudogriseolus TaxID=36817 RepID=UPI003FA2504C